MINSFVCEVQETSNDVQTSNFKQPFSKNKKEKELPIKIPEGAEIFEAPKDINKYLTLIYPNLEFYARRKLSSITDDKEVLHDLTTEAVMKVVGHLLRKTHEWKSGFVKQRWETYGIQAKKHPQAGKSLKSNVFLYDENGQVIMEKIDVKQSYFAWVLSILTHKINHTKCTYMLSITGEFGGTNEVQNLFEQAYIPKRINEDGTEVQRDREGKYLQIGYHLVNGIQVKDGCTLLNGIMYNKKGEPVEIKASKKERLQGEIEYNEEGIPLPMLNAQGEPHYLFDEKGFPLPLKNKNNGKVYQRDEEGKILKGTVSNEQGEHKKTEAKYHRMAAPISIESYSSRFADEEGSGNGESYLYAQAIQHAKTHGEELNELYMDPSEIYAREATTRKIDQIKNVIEGLQEDGLIKGSKYLMNVFEAMLTVDNPSSAKEICENVKDQAALEQYTLQSDYQKGSALKSDILESIKQSIDYTVKHAKEDLELIRTSIIQQFPNIRNMLAA